MSKINQIITQINQLALDIVVPYQALTFQAEVLSGDRLMITASTDPSYFDNFVITLDGVVFVSGHLVWHWNEEHTPLTIEKIEPNETLPILQDDCFFVRFNNVDLGIFPLIVMAKSIDLTIENRLKNYPNKLSQKISIKLLSVCMAHPTQYSENQNDLYHHPTPIYP